jgi:hypothetical protein
MSCRDRDQAAVSLGQLRAFPDVAKQKSSVSETSFGAKSPIAFCAGVMA